MVDETTTIQVTKRVREGLVKLKYHHKLPSLDEVIKALLEGDLAV